MSNGKMASWLGKNRASSRLAFLLQFGFRLSSSFLNFFWIRILEGALGPALYQSYLAFQKIATLGGLGDLGMGGAVAIRAGQLLGQEKRDELGKFLASARTAFLILALAAGGTMLALSPWLPKLLHFKLVDGSGSLTLLFAVGAFMVAAFVISSYVNNLNYACGNVLWPIIPAFVLLQIGLLGYWLLARQHLPLWVQFLPCLATTLAGIGLARCYIYFSHPAYSAFFPLRWHWPTIASLVGGSFWMYLWSLGNTVYRSTDSLLINASAFPAGTLTWYDSNYRICDVTVSLAVTAAFVTMPKITKWLASPDPQDQERASIEGRRLNQFQTLLGFCAALAYLAGNNLLMKIWWLHREHDVPAAPLSVQLAFALNMIVTSGGSAGLEIAGRSGRHGLRTMGLVILAMALLNMGLSLAAIHIGWLAGVALATVTAQSIQNLCSSFYACRHLRISWVSWMFRGWLLPVMGVLLAGWLRYQFSPYTPDNGLRPGNLLLLGVAYAAILAAMAAALGVTPAFIKSELRLLKSFARSGGT